MKKKVQRATLAQFRTRLAAISPAHALVIADLFSHPLFAPMVRYLTRCPRGTIDFNVRRVTERVRGRRVDVFGGFSPPFPGSRAAILLNPRRQEIVTNPLELVDTLVHEFIHAILELNPTCTSATNPFPLPPAVLDSPHDPELTALNRTRGEALERNAVAAVSNAGVTTSSGGNLLEYMDNNYGPAGSIPQTHYVDLNSAGMFIVTAIISSIHANRPAIGSETVSFDNMELLRASGLVGGRQWFNTAQRDVSARLHKDRVAEKRNIDPATFTDHEYDISAIQAVEFADAFTFDPNTNGSWGPVGGVWACHKRSRFTGRMLHTYVTGTPSKTPGGAVPYLIIQHT